MNVMSTVTPVPEKEHANGKVPQIIIEDDEVSLLSNTGQATTKTKLFGSTNHKSSFSSILHKNLIKANLHAAFSRRGRDPAATSPRRTLLRVPPYTLRRQAKIKNKKSFC